MYSVRLRSGARHGETPRIGGNPKNQPISELDIFSKRQALSRAVVVNSNMSRGKYLAREGPGSRLPWFPTVECLCLFHGCTKHPSLAQSASSIQSRGDRQVLSSLSPCDTTIHLCAPGPISVFVSRYTWYECAAGREKQCQNLIEKRILEHAVLQL